VSYYLLVSIIIGYNNIIDYKFYLTTFAIVWFKVIAIGTYKHVGRQNSEESSYGS